MGKACIVVAGLVISCVPLMACQSDLNEQQNTEFTVVGSIVAVEPSGGAYLLRIWVGDLTAPEPSFIGGADEIGLQVYSDTKISVKETGGELVPGTIDDLTVDVAIEARAASLLMLSDPPQARALEIVADRTQ